jgi:ATP-binding cassette subfamily F protein uup
VSRLSGGEQARLLIARLMLQPADVLMLDEPTNDLDIPTLDVLEDNLLEFPGALILVTHDRWLLDRVSTMMLALDGAGNAEWFADFAQWEAAQERGASGSSGPVPARAASNNGPKQKQARKGLSHSEQKEWDKIEGLIVKAEAAVAACQAATEDTTVMSNAPALQARYSALAEAQTGVEQLYARWTALEEKRARG